MKSMPFSVLMSVYAKEHPEYLSTCFDSLCCQTLLADEIVLVVDGPIGAQLQAVIDEYRERLPLEILPLSENVGLGRALNYGLQHCCHEWVFRMDTDDICVPERFAIQMNWIQAHSDTALVGGQVTEFTHTPRLDDKVKRVPVAHDEILAYAARRNPFNHMAVAYKKSVVLAVGGYQHHLGMEDYNLWLRILAAGYLTYNLPEILVQVRAGKEMHLRRRGLGYIGSEWQLAQLKHRLGFQAAWQAVCYFILRSSCRLLPVAAVGWLYRFLRR